MTQLSNTLRLANDKECRREEHVKREKRVTIVFLIWNLIRRQNDNNVGERWGL
jgi:hypothetical protein